ncbi:alpha/beta fold hydrolase [Aequorivita vladivostokensis]|uniref:alpha/beta fold hydrolase n=1 Tax=Aequorivita vladivostokensis TaxID=171194 RepID=UPI0009FD2C7C|nr:alpha/beta fold hydrolase [Aequorivita vladivostokensis]MAB58002.1 hypothetical protein [Aequorivita sp.]MBF30195.1 hypothetical protein [Aequorivita sp.]HAV53753.1 DUF1648 domain-containing protein [Aequorivita sp.]|tara:strand:+ start:8459 stop:10180 length:1722 start_codon:yes stop_codon:yes gene_type:complete
MQFNFKKEIPLILITVIPAIFLWYVWNSLPPEVPLHWNISGEVDRYGSKNELIWLTTLVPIFLYVLFLLVPLIDPKKKIAAMGGKFYTIRFYLTLFLSVLFTFIIYSVKEQTLTNPNYLFIIIGVFYVVLGNYFKTIKPNYFIGIRTPWALENETIWKSTHRLAGKLWVAGGLLIIITCFLFKQHTALTLFLIITAIITIIPVAHSYLQFKKITTVLILLLTSTSFFAQDNLNRPQTPQAPFSYNIEEVSFQNMQDSITLKGTFTYPKTGGNFTTAILISGSGPQNRNSEILGHKSFWVLADYLASHGIAVLRYDDRGVGESTGDFSKATSVDFAEDVVAAITYLEGRKEIDPKKIGLIGHSEGGVIAPMVASENKNVAFIVSMAGVMIPGSELLLLQKQLQLRSMGSSDSFISKEIEFDKGIMSTVTTSPVDSLKYNLEKYTSDFFKEHPNFPSEHGMTEAYYKTLIVESYSSPWLSNFIRYDPINALENVDCPFLALNGEKDLQVPAKENLGVLLRISEADTTKKITLKSYPGINHLFQECETGSVMEYAQIEQTLSPQVLKDITEWINNL